LSIHPPLNIAHYSVLFDFATKFTSLTKLVISLDNLPIHRLATCLSLLQQLFFLSIFIDFSKLVLSNQRSLVEESIENSVQLKSVQELTIFVISISHLDYQRLHLQHIFPNVEHIHWMHYNHVCMVCDYTTIRIENVEQNPTVQECMRLSRQPL